MRVDFICASGGAARGISRVEQPLAQALRADPRHALRVLDVLPTDGPLLFPRAYGPVAARLALARVEVVHIANSWYAHLVPFVRAPAIVTCHDLIDLEDLEAGTRHFKPHRRFHLRAAFRGMLRARFIVCVSESTARAVISRAPHLADRVRIVHSGVSPVFSPGPSDAKSLEQLSVEQPYVLYVGSEQPRKNLVRLVAAVAQARRTTPGLRLVKVGGHQTTRGREAFLAALSDFGLSQQTAILENVTDDQLVTLYRGAAVTALLSFQEGFGFPALEAMACGCPVVVSNLGALPEITHGAALTVDPLDVDAIAQAIQRTIQDHQLRRSLVKKGLLRAAGFTWDRAARAYGDLYQEAVRQA